MKIRSVRAELFHANRRTRGQTDGRTDGRMDGLTDRQICGKTEGQAKVKKIIVACAILRKHLKTVQHKK